MKTEHYRNGHPGRPKGPKKHITSRHGVTGGGLRRWRYQEALRQTGSAGSRRNLTEAICPLCPPVEKPNPATKLATSRRATPRAGNELTLSADELAQLIGRAVSRKLEEMTRPTVEPLNGTPLMGSSLSERD